MDRIKYKNKILEQIKIDDVQNWDRKFIEKCRKNPKFLEE